MYGILWITLVFWTATAKLENGKNHMRVKRQVDIKNLSPQDRESCRPGGTISSLRVDTTQRLNDLRAQFTANGISIQGYIIPSEDEHQSEFPAEYDKRRQYITGFSGSHGVAVVLRDKAALWTDGRYYTQAEQELDCNWILMKQDEPETPSYEEWVLAIFGPSSSNINRRIGLNPSMVTYDEWISIQRKLNAENVLLVQTNTDLVDRIWQFGRPAQPSSKINALSEVFAGKSWQQKVTEDVYSAMLDNKVDVLILTQLDEIAWLFNLRGSDVQYNPFFKAYAIIETRSGILKIRLFIMDRLRKMTEQPSDPQTTLRLDQHLNTGSTGSCFNKVGMCVEVEDYSKFINAVSGLNSDVNVKKFWVSYQCNYATQKILTKEIFQGNTPVALRKFQKNAKEQEGMRNANKRDAVALITLLASVEDKVKNNRFPRTTEASVSNELHSYRSKQLYNRGVSFHTIAAFGPNSAAIHYRPSVTTNREVTTDGMFLLDSGGQYLDGTTDVTRTLHYGEPTAYQKECYTRVLMGQIDLARFLFYKGAYGPYGREIDVIARRPLWEVGLDYRHGTGHGVGAYLSVHEGPGRISLAHPRVEKDVPLDEGQIFSDEPGYYEPNMFGVRLENMILIKRADTVYQFMDSKFLGFETLTLVPYEPHLIDYSLLSPAQIEWLNAYHNRVQTEIGPLIANDTLATQWLQARTQPYINKGEHLKTSVSLTIIAICVLWIIS